MKIKQPRRTVTTIEHRLDFDDRDLPGAGFSFPCTKEGEPLYDEAIDAAIENLYDYLGNPEGAQFNGVVTRSRDYREPAVGVCDDCGREVHLDDGLNNPCACGANYNMSGQRVKAIRDQFNEFGRTDDTNETWADVYGSGQEDW